ncbi:unnamed protein product [Amoebophrya sp. A25]|nr:unnamed protein product [Amoebophrya sp. A25]|eukprot:GSA25T00011401001.1
MARRNPNVDALEMRSLVDDHEDRVYPSSVDAVLIRSRTTSGWSKLILLAILSFATISFSVNHDYLSFAFSNGRASVETRQSRRASNNAFLEIVHENRKLEEGRVAAATGDDDEDDQKEEKKKEEKKKEEKKKEEKKAEDVDDKEGEEADDGKKADGGAPAAKTGDDSSASCCGGDAVPPAESGKKDGEKSEKKEGDDEDEGEEGEDKKAKDGEDDDDTDQTGKAGTEDAPKEGGSCSSCCLFIAFIIVLLVTGVAGFLVMRAKGKSRLTQGQGSDEWEAGGETWDETANWDYEAEAYQEGYADTQVDEFGGEQGADEQWDQSNNANYGSAGNYASGAGGQY